MDTILALKNNYAYAVICEYQEFCDDEPTRVVEYINIQVSSEALELAMGCFNSNLEMWKYKVWVEEANGAYAFEFINHGFNC